MNDDEDSLPNWPYAAVGWISLLLAGIGLFTSSIPSPALLVVAGLSFYFGYPSVEQQIQKFLPQNEQGYRKAAWWATGLACVAFYYRVLPPLPIFLLAAFCFYRGYKEVRDATKSTLETLKSPPMPVPPESDWPEAANETPASPVEKEMAAKFSTPWQASPRKDGGDDQPRCPKCGSTQVTFKRRGYTISSGLIGSEQLRMHCLRCHAMSKPGQPSPSGDRGGWTETSGENSVWWVAAAIAACILLGLLGVAF